MLSVLPRNKKRLRHRSDDPDEQAELDALAEHHEEMLLLAKKQRQQHLTTDELMLFAEMYPSEERALERLNEYAAERGFAFHLKTRHQWKKNPTAATVRFTCVHNRVKLNGPEQCRASVVARVNLETGECRLIQEGSCFVHTGHGPAYVVEDRHSIFADMLRMPFDADGTSSSALRLEWYARFPRRPICGGGGGGEGLRDDAASKPLPYYYRWGEDQLKAERFTAKRVIKQVEMIASRQAFEMHLDEGDRDYLSWWVGKGFGGQEVVYLRVHGCTSIDVQQSLTYMQRHVEGGLGQFVVFPNALLAINAYALRAYRVLTCQFLTKKDAMPLAPLLLQGWALRPRQQDTFNRMGIYSTLLFLAQSLCRRSQVYRTFYSVQSEQFQLYDYLPEFVSLICKNANTEMAMALGISLFRQKEWNALAQHEMEDDNCFVALLLSFIMQKEDHYICSETLDTLKKYFSSMGKHNELKNKYPYADAVIDHLFYRKSKMGSTITPMYIPSWDKVKLYHWLKRPTAEYQPQYYLYQLCFEKELLPLLVRRDLAFAITIASQVAPPLKRNLRDVSLRADAKHEAGPHRTAEVLERYPAHFERPVPEAMARFFTPFSKEKRDLWPLNTLFALLAGVDHLRRNHVADVLPEQDMPDEYTPREVLGPLSIGDAAKSCLRQIDWPVAYHGGGKVSYFEESLWVWNGHYHPDIASPHVAAVDACLLARDPCYYFQKNQQQQQH